MVKEKVEKTTKKKDDGKEKLVVSFKSKLSPEKETVELEVVYNKPLQMILRKVAVGGNREFSMNIGRDENGVGKTAELKRTRVKTAIWNGFESDGRDYLFVEDLVLKGKYTFEFYDVSILERTISIITANINRAVELISNCSNIKHKVEFIPE